MGMNYLKEMNIMNLKEMRIIGIIRLRQENVKQCRETFAVNNYSHYSNFF